MLQNVIVLLILAGCGLWLGLRVFRFFKPLPSGKACGGSCCDSGGDAAAPAAKAGGTKGQGVVMISSDDLRARLKARRG